MHATVSIVKRQKPVRAALVVIVAAAAAAIHEVIEIAFCSDTVIQFTCLNTKPD